MVMEAKKSHDLPSASWRPRKASGLSTGASAGETEAQANSSFYLSSVQALNRLDKTHPRRGGQSASSSLRIQVLLSSGNILTDSPGILFTQISGYPVHIKLTITGRKIKLRKEVVWSRRIYSEKLVGVSPMVLWFCGHWVILGNCRAICMDFGDFFQFSFVSS